VNAPLLHQDWLHLLFLHWRVQPDQIRALLPPDLTLDLFQETAYVGLIPFTIKDSRPRIIPPIPGLSSFHEVNVRTYVLHDGKPGIFFFSLDASSRAAVLGARTMYKLPYHFAHIEMVVDEDDRSVKYSSKREWPEPLPATCELEYSFEEGRGERAKPGTIAHFLIERYTLYTVDDGQLISATVEHEPYSVLRADLGGVQETLLWAAGVRKSEETPIAHYSPGVSVDINAPVRL
jgi:uncharacterized protein YqjF (DUF2071 family)